MGRDQDHPCSLDIVADHGKPAGRHIRAGRRSPLELWWPPNVKPPRVKAWFWLKWFVYRHFKRTRLGCYLPATPLVDLTFALESKLRREVERPPNPRFVSMRQEEPRP